MMSRQTMVALGVAVILGLLAVYFANVFLNGTQKRAELAGTSKIAVAALPMGYGSDITADKVRFVDFPNSSIPAGAFRDGKQLWPEGKKRFALVQIGVNEPILANKVSGEGQGASIAALLPEGMRAATVRVNAVSGVAGFVQPNDHVDVLITRTPPNGDGTQVTDVLLQNIRVIAIDQKAKNDEGKPDVARTATLEVTPLDAQKLALGEAAGNLSLVLRKPGEPNNPVVETVSLSDLRYNLYGGARYPAPAVVGGFAAPQVAAAAPRPAPRRAAPPRKPTPPKPNVEVYRGTKSDQYTVGG